MSNTNQICITCTQRDTCQYYDPNRTICVPIMTEQEMQFELMKSQEKVNALRQEVAEMNKEREYWQHYRIQASIAAMQGLISGGIYTSSTIRLAKERGQSGTEFIAQMATEFADDLIAELQKKGGKDDSNVHNN